MERYCQWYKEDVLKNGWKNELQTFTQTYSNSELDASLLLMAEYGFISADDWKYQKQLMPLSLSFFTMVLFTVIKTPMILEPLHHHLRFVPSGLYRHCSELGWKKMQKKYLKICLPMATTSTIQRRHRFHHKNASWQFSASLFSPCINQYGHFVFRGEVPSPNL